MYRVSEKSRRPWNRCRVGGLAMMVAGLIIMMLVVPCWAWAGMICAVVIAVGFMLWRFS